MTGKKTNGKVTRTTVEVEWNGTVGARMDEGDRKTKKKWM